MRVGKILLKCCIAIGALSISAAYATGGYVNLFQVSENYLTSNPAYYAYNIKSVYYSIEFYGTNGGVGPAAWRSSVVRSAPTVTYQYAPSWEKNRHLWVPSATDSVSIVKDSNEFFADDIGTLVGNYLSGATTNSASNGLVNDCGDEYDIAGDPDGAQDEQGVEYCFASFRNNNAGLSDTATVYITVNYQDYNNAWHSETVGVALNRPGTTTNLHAVCFNPGRVTSWVPGENGLEHGPNSPGMLLVTNGSPC